MTLIIIVALLGAWVLFVMYVKNKEENDEYQAKMKILDEQLYKIEFICALFELDILDKDKDGAIYQSVRVAIMGNIMERIP